MKKRNHALLLLLIVTTILVAALGCYLKYIFLVPFDLYREEQAMAVPFLLLVDKPAQNEILMSLKAPQTEVVPTEAPVEAPTEELIPEQTEGETEVPTEPPTEAPTEPIVIDESWFDDVLFIGDSRTRTLSNVAPLGKAHYFCDTGLSVFDVRYKKCYSKDFYSTRLDDLLEQNTYGKIYVMLGINGMYMPHDDIIAEYVKLIELLREKEPDAVVVLNAIMTVGRVKANYSKNYSLESIYGLNARIAELADGEHIFYLDVNDFISDEEGYLPDNYTKDGIHLFGDKYAFWVEWLMESAATLGIR